MTTPLTLQTEVKLTKFPLPLEIVLELVGNDPPGQALVILHKENLADKWD